MSIVHSSSLTFFRSRITSRAYMYIDINRLVRGHLKDLISVHFLGGRLLAQSEKGNNFMNRVLRDARSRGRALKTQRS